MTHLESVCGEVNTPRTNTPDTDPILAAFSRKRLWQECVRASDLRRVQKDLLLAIGRHLDVLGLGSKMSYPQLAREAGTTPRTAIKHIRRLDGVWIARAIRIGFKHKKGRCNLYDAVVPERWVAAARRRLSKALAHNLWSVNISGGCNLQSVNAGRGKTGGPFTRTRTVRQRDNSPEDRQDRTPTSAVGTPVCTRKGDSKVIDFAAARARLALTTIERRVGL